MSTTVTIGISAYNENRNLGRLLAKLLSQKALSFKLEKILVISDGSTDDTASVARSVSSSRIHVIEDKRRLGKALRMNQMFKTLRSDILVVVDADTDLEGMYVIEKLIKPFSVDRSIAMCNALAKPLSGKTFTEKAVNHTYDTYLSILPKIKAGDSLFSVSGRMIAYRKAFVKKFKLPRNLIGTDAFTYFKCLSLGYKFKLVESAVVYFRSPVNLKDQIKQNTRFVSRGDRLSKYFPKDLISKESKIPSMILIGSMASQLIKDPIKCIYIFLVNRYCYLLAKFYSANIKGGWEIARSTKILR